jgi:serine/threonine-protein kinase
MNEEATQSTPSSMAKRTASERICREFEAACQAGQPPKLEEFLGDTPEPERSELRRALEAVAAQYHPAAKEGVSLAEFVRRLSQIGLMSAAEVQASLDRCPAGQRPATAEQLARELYRLGKLTKFQAQAVYQGKTRGLVLGNYILLDSIGKGGMGHVYKAQHKRMRRIVALKVLPAAATQSKDLVKRFQREVEAAARLSHPNVVTAHDADEDQGIHFLVMEYVEGQDLSSVVKQCGPLPVAEAVEAIRQAAQGLDYAHQQGVIHRDIKPANLLRDKRGTIKLLDMGLARFSDAGTPTGASVDHGLTLSGQVMGTLDYMSPEQALDTRTADARADIYSLGCTLHYLLTGHGPYGGDTLTKKLLAHREDPVPSLRAVRPDVPEALDRLFQRMVAKRAEDRVQTMGEVLTELQQMSTAVSCAATTASKTVAATAARQETTETPADSLTDTLPLPPPEADLGTGTLREPIPAVEHYAPPKPALGKRVRRAVRRVPGRRVLVQVAVAIGLAGMVAVVWWLSVVLRVPTPGGTSMVEINEPVVPGAQPPPRAVAPFDAKQAQEHQAAWARYLGVPVEMMNSIGMQFALIPPGEFDMGSTEAEVARLREQVSAEGLPVWYSQRLPAEAPKHRVRMTKPFWFGRHEVTRGQFRRFVEDRGYKTEAERDGKGGWGFGKRAPRFFWNGDLGFEQTDDDPVVNVTWNDAAAFCAWLSEKEGGEFHLPSEAQWEYACRAGTTTNWCSGDAVEALQEQGWIKDNAGEKTHPVGQKSPNAWGLYDVHGNVWEWCQDWLGDRYYAASPTDDPTGATGGSDRVLRGGGWSGNASLSRASFRNWDQPGNCYAGNGFRIAGTVSRPDRSPPEKVAGSPQAKERPAPKPSSPAALIPP